MPAVQRYANAPVKAALAGDDILMFAQAERGSEDAYVMLREAVRSGALPATLVAAAANRVDALKRVLLEGSVSG